jgi:hypothetical protein
MAKLQEMFAQARRTQGGGGIGFLGKSKNESKAHAAALVVEFSKVVAGSAEAALKAGADGLLFAWDGKDTAVLETLKQEIDSARASNEDLVCGLHITGGLDALDRESFTQIKDHGIQYIVLPFEAPAHLLALEKDLEKVVTVPVRTGDMYPLFIRNIATLNGIAAVLLDFGVSKGLGSLSIEDVLNYHAISEAVHMPTLINVKGDLNEADAYTLYTLGVQAVVLPASSAEETTRKQVRALRTLLEEVQKAHEDEKNNSSNSAPRIPHH